VREADLSRHLDSGKKSTDAKKNDDESKDSGKASKDPIEFGSDRDFQLKQAINLLRGLPVKTDDVPEKFS
jgi:carboxyl-terminal processing protease